MASSLDKLSSNLKTDQFVNLKKYDSGNHLNLLLRKGVHPYNYIDSINKLDETSLPSKEAFCSKLTGEGITDEDYQHAQTFWKEFSIESMKYYHNLYNRSNVVLLADFFRKLQEHLPESLWTGSGLVFQCARSCLGCCFNNYKGSTRIIMRFRHVVNDLKWYQRRNRNNITPPR